MSSFDTVRDLKLPGLVVGEVYIDPTQWTTRMRNAVLRMLRTGVAVGGWSSKSKQLAVKLAHGVDIGMLSLINGRGVFTPSRVHTLPAAAVEEIITLIDAHEAITVLEAQQHFGAEYARQHIEFHKGRHRDMRAVIKRRQAGRWLPLDSDHAPICEQVAEVFVRYRSPEQVAAAEKLCTMIENGALIPVTLGT